MMRQEIEYPDLIRRDMARSQREINLCPEKTAFANLLLKPLGRPLR